jgi:hypothetical protein
MSSQEYFPQQCFLLRDNAVIKGVKSKRQCPLTRDTDEVKKNVYDIIKLH